MTLNTVEPRSKPSSFPRPKRSDTSPSTSPRGHPGGRRPGKLLRRLERARRRAREILRHDIIERRFAHRRRQRAIDVLDVAVLPNISANIKARERQIWDSSAAVEEEVVSRRRRNARHSLLGLKAWYTSKRTILLFRP